MERDTVPEWAQLQSTSSSGAWTPKRRELVQKMINQKQLDSVQIEWLVSELEKDVTHQRASEIITRLLKLPDKVVETVTDGIPTSTQLGGLPPGRYAVNNEDGELRFYQCWESKNKEAKRLYVLFGPSEAKLPWPVANAIAQKILASGVRECAIRFGMEIKHCSNCNRRLTHRISRELGIGPICGGRMFGGEDWTATIKAKRQEIIDRGEDPDEELDD